MPSVPVTVPSVGESISEGIIARWHKADGALVRAGEPLFELETDKATSDIPAAGTGVLRITVPEGETVAVGATVATIDPADSAATQAAPTPAPAQKNRQTEPTKEPAAKGPAEPPATRPAREPKKTSPEPEPAPASEPVPKPLSPAVRRIVSEEGVDISQVPATGPGGRVTKGDVLAHLEAPGAKVAPSSTSPTAAKAPSALAGTQAASDSPRETRQRMSGLRQRIAQRLVEVQQTAAILTTFNEVDMSRVIALRTLYKESFQKKHGVGLGFMSFFIKASIDALKAFPAVNARIDGNEIVYHNFYDIGVAVSTDRGLMVPVVRSADQRSFAAIEQAILEYATRARAGTITVDDLQGGTFTITNGGTFGSLLSTPILNPPQSAILGMHAMKKRPVVVDDQIVIRSMMYLALSYDHRLIDGRDAVSFLVRIKDCIENPERMMLEL
jgi:2-oxoglutarate dehydrogenase E2 component (dihydrolipoamide succinyltransferase)